MLRSLTRAAWAAATVGLAVAGCGGGGTTSGESAFRTNFLAARPQVAAIVAQVQSTVAAAGRHPDVLLAGQFTSLGSRVANEAYAVAALAPPARYNTRVRDLGSALLRTANDLDQLATAATRQSAVAVAAVRRELRGDVRTVRLTQAAVADALRLPAASA